MIIRAPTRTMTKSFSGKQMGFKFPSVDNQPEALDEYHLNNHHLLNDNITKSHQKVNNEDDGVSQIQSDYTSASNANTNSGNSSNGYYSFANISDNTTTMPCKTQSYASSPKSNGSGDGGKASELTVPRDEQHNISSQKSLEPMEVIPEGNDNAPTSTSLNVQSIPTADNFSFDIASSNSLRLRSTTKEVDATSDLQNSPSFGSSKSSALSLSISNNSSYSSKFAQHNKKSQLKRSASIKCKGGLLHYFLLLGTRIKRTLRKIRMALRRKRSERTVSAKGSVTAVNSKMASRPRLNVTRSSSKKEITSHLTSHLNRTNGYVSNLQRSVSLKSLPPLQEETKSATNVTRRPPPGASPSKFVTPPGSRIVRKPTTPLRRTPSSIRRAASVIRTPMPAGPSIPVPSGGSVYEESVIGSPKSANATEISKVGLVRSGGSKSLNSLVRQRSIVVKNKVIPLSMHHYSIREEDEYREPNDQFVIKSSSMYSLSPVNSVSSEEMLSMKDSNHSINSSLSEINIGDYTDAYEEMNSQCIESDISVESSECSSVSYVQSFTQPPANPIVYEELDGSSESLNSDSLGKEIEDFTTNLNHYFKYVIAQRIKLRLQLSQYQSANSLSSSYLDLIESILGAYESEPGAGNSPGESYVPLETASEEDALEESDELVPLSCADERDTIRINVQSPCYRRGASKHSILSLRSGDVKRSLTLPIGMKV
ncbi:related to Altered inheritance of mitochondria protein 44 [Zygosaccharomyces bailii]|nr:related to Altered inheritance of mitochondria protein 44 [Zygosaccharomyces bailii]